MFPDSFYDPIADLEAVLAAHFHNVPNPVGTRSEARLISEAPITLVAETLPEIVAGAVLKTGQNSQSRKGFSLSCDQTYQCVIPSPSTTPTPSTKYISSSDTLDTKAGKKSRKSYSAPSTSTRQPRRAAAKLDGIAMKKTWEGSKGKGRKDKLTKTEKFSAAVWSVAASHGMAVSLNLGIPCQAMLWGAGDPQRRMMQNLHKHLSSAGFGDLPYAFAFEITSNALGGRVHLHGAIDTSGLSDADMPGLDTALRRAASHTSGAIGGQRQLDLRPLHDPAGWVDYILKDKARTARVLGVDDIVFMNDPMRRLAKEHFNLVRKEVIARSVNTKNNFKKSASSGSKAAKIDVHGFTSPAICDTKYLSGERDQTLVGGASEHMLRRPHQSKQRNRASARSAALGRRSVRSSIKQPAVKRSSSAEHLPARCGSAMSSKAVTPIMMVP